MNAKNVLHFWFEELSPTEWFRQSDYVDEQIRLRFEELHNQASRGELFHWRSTPEGRLAEIIILDQFSRNIYRHSPRAFEQDPLALILAEEMVLLKLDKEVPVHMRPFVYMPFMHSESIVIHKFAEELFKQPGLENNYDYELKHLEILQKFGRYPHRNEALGRTSTPMETEFIKVNPGF